MDRRWSQTAPGVGVPVLMSYEKQFCQFPHGLSIRQIAAKLGTGIGTAARTLQERAQNADSGTISASRFRSGGG
jgi:hypothetical protein